MTRRIKFRAWNGEKMSHGFGFNDIAYEGIPFDVFTNDEQDEIREGVVFMQFTGLYDKNNQPIYEGDVVSVRSPGTPHNYRFTQLVQFSQGMFHSGNHPLYLMCEVEIIGNLYEHPHLLTNDQGN